MPKWQQSVLTNRDLRSESWDHVWKGLMFHELGANIILQPLQLPLLKNEKTEADWGEIIAAVLGGWCWKERRKERRMDDAGGGGRGEIVEV